MNIFEFDLRLILGESLVSEHIFAVDF